MATREPLPITMIVAHIIIWATRNLHTPKNLTFVSGQTWHKGSDYFGGKFFDFLQFWHFLLLSWHPGKGEMESDLVCDGIHMKRLPLIPMTTFRGYDCFILSTLEISHPLHECLNEPFTQCQNFKKSKTSLQNSLIPYAMSALTQMSSFWGYVSFTEFL